MLTTIDFVNSMPGMCNTQARPPAWVNALLKASDRAVKKFLKRDVELTAYTEYHDGTGQQDIVLRQWPSWTAQTRIAPASSGQVLPQSTIFVDSIAGFHPGTLSNPNANPPAIALQTGVTTWTFVNYTGVQPNPANPNASPAFTGCTGGTGTLQRNPANSNPVPFSVSSPVVNMDWNARQGQNAAAFGDQTILVPGIGCYLLTDLQGGDQSDLPLGVNASRRGLLRNSGGGGPGFGWWGPPQRYGSKLAGSRQPYWPVCTGGIKVQYVAGYLQVPYDIQYACAMLVASMVRMMPKGENMASENLGAYSYSLLVNGQDPELGTIRRTLMPHRESAW